jgi:hypothetical protein
MLKGKIDRAPAQMASPSVSVAEFTERQATVHISGAAPLKILATLISTSAVS